MNIEPLNVAASNEQIVELGRRMCAASRFERLGYCPERVKVYANMILNDPLFIGFGLFEEGEMVGMVVGTCGQTMPFTKAIVANEHLLFIDSAHRTAWAARKLIASFIAEAKRRGARDIVFSNGTGYEPVRVGRLFEVCGLPQVGGLYALEV